MKSRFLAACMAAMMSVAGISVAHASAAAPAASQDKAKTITMIGYGMKSAAPDLAYLIVGAMNTDKKPKNAVTKVAEMIDALKKKLIESGIKEDEISTESYFVSPNYDYSKGNGSFTINDYQVQHMLRVKVSDVSKVGDLIDISVAAGSNNMQNVEFALKDADAAEADALADAFANAKLRAEAVAKAAGLTLGDVIEIQPNNNGGYNPSGMYKETAARDSAASTQIMPGQIRINESVTVVFGVK